jgi:hypothetical protein
MGQPLAQYGLQHKRARLAGEIKGLQRKLAKQQAALARLQSEISTLEHDIASHSQDLSTLDIALQTLFQVEPSPHVRETWPKAHRADWGAVTRMALRLLREAGGQTVLTGTLVKAIAERLDLSLESSEDWAGFRKTVRTALKQLTYRGVIRRLHAQQTSEEGQWALADFAE